MLGFPIDVNYPSASSEQSEKFERLGVKFGNIDKTFPDNPTFHNFEEWFMGWVSSPTTSSYLDLEKSLHVILSEVFVFH